MNSPTLMQRDFKKPLFEHKKNSHGKRRPLLIGAISLAAAVSLVAIFPTNATDPTPAPDATPLASADINNQPIAVALNSSAVKDSLAPQIGKWHTTKIRTGDSLSTAFDRIGLPASLVLSIMNLGTDSKVLTRLQPGDELKIYTSQDNRQLRSLRYQIDTTHHLEITQGPEGLNSQIIEVPLETRITHATGTIDSSLFLAAQQSGLSDNLTMELANLFGWDIDFVLDIRTGDKFSLVYEEHYLEGKKVRDGNILAAEFVNQNHSYRAIRFTDKNNRSSYYTPNGKSIRKAFLRSPVDFRRISSRFNPRRKHPVLNRIRAHKGVDYAAKRGTPIRATGDGKVILRGIKGGYGRTIIIQHGSKYSTLYAHMNSYARGIRRGKKVRQGQTIGYVGSSGLATGPHLHYEFRLNGVHRNPLTIRLPDAAPLPKRYQTEFNTLAQPLLVQLDTMSRMALAMNNRQTILTSL